MKKTALTILVCLFFLSWDQTAGAEIILRFDFKNVSQVYVEFINEFSSRIAGLLDNQNFKGSYIIEVREGLGVFLDEEGKEKKELVIAMIINKGKDPESWVFLDELLYPQALREKAEEFSKKAVRILKKLEAERGESA